MDHCGQYTPLLAFLKAVPDPRKARGKVFPWEFLLLGVCAALLSGQQTGSAISRWIAEHAQAIAAFARVKLRLTPSHSTIRRALRNVGVEALEDAVTEHNEALDKQDQTAGTLIGADGQPLRGEAIDGKEVRGAGAHGVKVHLLSLVRHGSGTTLVQEEVAVKSNEIPAVPELLAGRNLAGTVITLDALNTQRATAQRILTLGGDYLMIVKENQPTLQADIETFFQATPPRQEDERDTYTYSGKGHGRLETRTLTCITGLDGYLNWPGAKQVVKRRCQRVDCKSGKVEAEVTYAVTSLDRRRAGARHLELLWRGHWTIENKSHHVRDVTMLEDQCQMHKGNAPRALAALKNGLLAALRYHGWDNIAAAISHYAASARRALTFLTGNALGKDPARTTQACAASP